MKPIAYGVYALIFLVALASGVAAGVPGLVERAGERVEARLEAALDAEITWDRADWSLDGRVELGGVTLTPRSAPAGEAPLVTIGKLVVRADVRVFDQRVKVEAIELDGVVVDARRRGDGSDNVRRVVRGGLELAGLGEAGGDGAGGGGLSSLLVRYVPEVVARDVTVIADVGDVDLPDGLRVPTRLMLAGGEIRLKNTALAREDIDLDVTASFEDTTLDPGYGLSFETKVSTSGASWPVSLSFERPARVMLGQRVLSVGGVRWKGSLHDPIEVDRIALSVPLGADALGGSAPVDPALTVRTARVRPGDMTLSTLAELAEASDRVAAARKVIESIDRIELLHPALVFERREEGHSFSDLVPEPPAPATDDAVVAAPDKALGVLMQASRAASERLSGRQARRDGERFRGFLLRGFTRLESATTQLSEAAITFARRVPFTHLVVRGGHFVYRDHRSPGDEQHADTPWLAQTLDKFDLDARRRGETLTFDAAFVVPRQGEHGPEEGGELGGKVHLVSGDAQLHAKLPRLRLHPYRALFPASVVVDEGTELRDTDLTLTWSPSGQLARVEGVLGLEDVGFVYPALATEPLAGMDLRLTFKGQLDRERKTLVLGQSDLRLGKMVMKVRGDVSSYDTDPRLTGALRLERTRAQDVADSLPRQVVPLLEGLEVVGTVAWHLDFTLDTRDMDSLVYHSYPELNGFRVVDMGDRLNLDAVQGAFLHRIVEADGTRRDMLIGPGSPTWVPLDRISDYMVKAVTTTEDGAFYRHDGFSGFAIRNSIVTNLKKGGFVRGASTISQQLVKNLFLSREKTISRKVQEMFITWQLERALSKDRIMELYLNVIEWGPGIYGVRQASEHYFGKQPEELTALEAVFLASLIPNPKRYYHQFERGQVTDGWRRHLRWIMGVMVERGKLSQAEYDAAWPYTPSFRKEQPQTQPGGAADPAPDGPVPTNTAGR